MATERPDPYPDDSYVFGPIIGPHDVDECLYDIIHLWQVSYLREVARRAGEDPDELVPFRSWRVSHEMERMPEDQTPALIIQNLGLEDEPIKRGTLRPGKSFYAVYKYRIGVCVSAKGKKVKAAPRANKVAKMYATAVRSIMIQKRDDRSILGMLDWVDDLPGPIDSEDDRTFAMWVVEFNVEVPNSAAWATGPMEPDPLPVGEADPPLLGRVETTHLTIDKVPIEDPFPEGPPGPEPPEPPPDPILLATVRGVKAYDIDRLASPTLVNREIKSTSDITDISGRNAVCVVLDRTTTSDHEVTIQNDHPTSYMTISWYDEFQNYLMISTSVQPGTQGVASLVVGGSYDCYGVAYFADPGAIGNFRVSVTNSGVLVPPP